MWHDQTVPRNEVLAHTPHPPTPNFFLGPLSLAAAFPAHVSTSFETKETFVLLLCNRRIPKKKKIIFNSRGEDLPAAPKGTLNKQKSASAKFEVTPANRRLLLCGDTTLLGVSGVLLLHHRTKESVLFFPGIKRRGVGARVGDGPPVP